MKNRENIDKYVRDPSNSLIRNKEIKDEEYQKKKLIDMIKSSIEGNDEIPKTTLDHYRIVKMIGKGAFG